MTRFDDAVCIITGAGSSGPGWGIGKATAVQLAREGARLVLLDRERTAVDETRALVEAEGAETEVVVGDLTDPATARRLADAAMERFGRIDALQNTIGISPKGTVLDTDVALWDRTMAINATTTMLSSQQVIPHMIAGGGGSIVNISSLRAIRPGGMAAYSASKGAVIALSQAMAVDHASDGVRVNCIAPGPILTPHVGAADMDPELRERRRLATPLRVEGTAWDIAYASAYLLSNEARFVTGLTIPIDGGVSVSSPARG